MRGIRKLVALILTLTLLAGITVISVLAATEPTTTAEATETAEASATATAHAEDTTAAAAPITVTLRIESIEECVFERIIELSDEITLADLMTRVTNEEPELAITIKNMEWGAYITSMCGLDEFDHGGMSGWQFFRNGLEATEGMTNTILTPNDEIVFYYGDSYGLEITTQYPRLDMSRLMSAGIIRIHSWDNVYDENWNAELVDNPVVGAKVTFNSEILITDENGEIKVADKNNVAGINYLKIERYDEESGLPTLIRFEAHQYEYFADVTENIWYDDAVLFSVAEGYFKGVGNNRFAPLSKMTVEQLVTVLSRVAGAENDESKSPWYTDARDWAFENDVITIDEFVPGENITRQQFIYLFYVTAELAGEYDMELEADITDAVDYDDIDEDYLEAVSWAVATGIISGTDSASLTVSPLFEVNRATVCQMLYNYYN